VKKVSGFSKRLVITLNSECSADLGEARGKTPAAPPVHQEPKAPSHAAELAAGIDTVLLNSYSDGFQVLGLF
jgi:hypothetical protein